MCNEKTFKEMAKTADEIRNGGIPAGDQYIITGRQTNSTPNPPGISWEEYQESVAIIDSMPFWGFVEHKLDEIKMSSIIGRKIKI